MRESYVPQIKVALTLCVLGLLCAALTGSRRAAADTATTVDVVERYNQEIAKNYDFKFGANPFAPSNATTTTGKFIPAEMFVPAMRCQKCHPDAHAQW